MLDHFILSQGLGEENNLDGQEGDSLSGDGGDVEVASEASSRAPSDELEHILHEMQDAVRMADEGHAEGNRNPDEDADTAEREEMDETELVRQFRTALHEAHQQKTIIENLVTRSRIKLIVVRHGNSFWNRGFGDFRNDYLCARMLHSLNHIPAKRTARQNERTQKTGHAKVLARQHSYRCHFAFNMVCRRLRL